MDGFIKSRIVMRGDVTCPIALAATVLSDQWTVIVLRDIAFFNQRTFGAILENNNEKIPRPTLANRLKRLCDIGLLKARSDAKHAQPRFTIKGILLCAIKPRATASSNTRLMAELCVLSVDAFGSRPIFSRRHS